MPNNIIHVSKWKHDMLPTLECLYGYSHKYSGYLPFKEIKDIVKIGNTSRIGIKGIDENDEKLYIQLSIKDQKAIESKNWFDLDKYGLSNMKVISNPKIGRWDKVKFSVKNDEIAFLEIEGIVNDSNSYELNESLEFVFLGHLKENAAKAIIQSVKTKSIYLIFKDKIKKI